MPSYRSLTWLGRRSYSGGKRTPLCSSVSHLTLSSSFFGASHHLWISSPSGSSLSCVPFALALALPTAAGLEGVSFDGFVFFVLGFAESRAPLVFLADEAGVPLERPFLGFALARGWSSSSSSESAWAGRLGVGFLDEEPVLARMAFACLFARFSIAAFFLDSLTPSGSSSSSEDSRVSLYDGGSFPFLFLPVRGSSSLSAARWPDF